MGRNCAVCRASASARRALRLPGVPFGLPGDK